MYRQANRASFLGKQGCSCLARCYGKLVAIEIVLKDHLGPNGANVSHDVPALLGKVAAAGAHQTPPILAAPLNSKAQQLSQMLRLLSCSSKTGQRMLVPPSSYPFMRYIFHESDGTHTSDVKEQDLIKIGTLADDIISLLSNTYQVTA